MIGLPHRSLGRRVPPVPPALLLVCLAATAAACTASPELGDPGGEALRSGFPKYAAAVLERGSELAPSSRGFEVIRTEHARARAVGAVALPTEGAQPIVFSPRGSAEVHVREVGLVGQGEIVDRAVSYGVKGGTSYWQATPGGAEEWLLFEAGAVTSGRAAAIWEVAGAIPVQRGAAVAIYTERGKRLLTVTAPAAYLADGSDAPVRLSVRGATIELYVEAGNQEVLVDPSWTFVASMNEQRLGHTAARLTSGDVLVAGGETTTQPQALPGQSNAFASYTAEIYNPGFDEWNTLPGMLDSHREHAMVTQPGNDPPNGAALVIAGRNDDGTFLTATEQYDGGFWQSKAALFDLRAGHTGTRLQDDRVLVAGGYNDCGGVNVALPPAPPAGNDGAADGLPSSGLCFLCTAEVFDPVAASGYGEWLGTGQLSFCRALHTETLLTDGSVLVTGGQDPSGVIPSAEIWTPVTGVWSLTAPMVGSREGHTATRLNDGTVLVTGGADGQMPVATAELYNPVQNTWMSVGPMQAARTEHVAVLMNDGTVLISGGYDNNGASFTAEIYDPATQQFTLTENMNENRALHTGTLLADGNVLVTGGDNFFGDPPITGSAEIFSLVGQLGGTCSVASDCQSNFCVDGVCCDSVCDQPCEACTDAARGGGGNVPSGKPLGGYEASAVSGAEVSGSGSGGDGFCGPVNQGWDPAEECADMDPSSCGTIGWCNGSGSCELYEVDTICQDSQCVETEAQSGGLCDGEGNCIKEPSVDCAPYACTDGVCVSDCVDPADCSPFAFCDGVVHTCAPKKDDGSVAFDPVQCVSGIIADGVCCDQACDMPCHACSQQTGAATDGICTPVSDFQCDDGSACTQVDTCQEGQCVGGVPVICPGDTGCEGGLACDDKSGQCSLPTPPKKIGEPCDDGLACTTGEVCTAAGACQGTAVVCSPDECQEASTCVEGKGCEPVAKPNYTPCSKDDNPCTIGWCITGACVPNNLTDYSLCPGGVCIGGSCLPDGSADTTGGGSVGGGGGGGSGGGGQGAEGGGGSAGGPAGSGGGDGGNPPGGGKEPAYKLLGAGCAAAPGGAPASPSGWAAALGLLGLLGIRRRKAARG